MKEVLELPCSIRPVRQLVASLKDDVFRGTFRVDLGENVREVNTCEYSGGQTGCSPGETERLLDDVLLLSSVPSADQRDGKSYHVELGA